MISLFYNMDVEGNVNNHTDKEKEQISYRMIQILLLLLPLLLLLFCSATSDCRATLTRLFFCLSLCIKVPIGFNYFPSVALISHAAKSQRVKGD